MFNKIIDRLTPSIIKDGRRYRSERLEQAWAHTLRESHNQELTEAFKLSRERSGDARAHIHAYQIFIDNLVTNPESDYLLAFLPRSLTDQERDRVGEFILTEILNEPSEPNRFIRIMTDPNTLTINARILSEFQNAIGAIIDEYLENNS